MTILTTDRLKLRLPAASDAAFILRLLNDPDWLRHIGDRGVRTQAQAERYIADRLLQSFRSHGFGLWVVEEHEGSPLGLCGLLKRDTLEDVDLGYAFLPEARGRGIAREAARRALQFAAGELALRRVVAITTPSNAASARLLEQLGLCFERVIDYEGAGSLRLYAIDFGTGFDGLRGPML